MLFPTHISSPNSAQKASTIFLMRFMLLFADIIKENKLSVVKDLIENHGSDPKAHDSMALTRSLRTLGARVHNRVSGRDTGSMYFLCHIRLCFR